VGGSVSEYPIFVAEAKGRELPVRRFTIRLARPVDQAAEDPPLQPCYQGTVKETLHRLDRGEVRFRLGNIGPPGATIGNLLGRGME
jgi:hypothetical protein